MDLKKIAANKTMRLIGGIYFVLSAVTSFAFFFVHLPAFVPLPFLGAEMASVVEPVISGLIGVALFDLAAIKWLEIYLYGSGNNDQRDIAQRAFWVGFWGSAASSFAYIFLTGNNLVVLPTEAAWWMSITSIFIIAASVVFNFYSKIVFDSHSNQSKEAIREAERLGRIQEAEANEADYLDDLIAQNVKERLNQHAAELASEQAEKIVAERLAIERAKYANKNHRPPRPTGSPQREVRAFAANGRPPANNRRPDPPPENFT
jgi:hypothetical protein